MRSFVPGTVIPAFLDPGKWSACFGMSYTDLLVRDTIQSQRIIRPGGKHLRYLTQSGGISGSRNRAAKDFLDSTDAEFLWMIDTDMGFAADVVDRMVGVIDGTREIEVLGALAFALKRDAPSGDMLYGEHFKIVPTVYGFYEVDGESGFKPDLDYARDSVVEVTGTGAACLMVRASALEEVRRKYGDTWFDPITLPHGDKGNPRTFSEDLSFCLRLIATGIPLHVDTSIKTTHEKGGIFLDESTYDRFRKASK
jgi:hypothetical protein